MIGGMWPHFDPKSFETVESSLETDEALRARIIYVSGIERAVVAIASGQVLDMLAEQYGLKRHGRR